MTAQYSKPGKLPSNWITTFLVFFLCLICVILVQGLQAPNFFDDAYITFRYARNISQGQGFVYNQGEKVLGTTSPLFALLLAGPAWVFDTEVIPSTSFYISVLADTINLLLIYRLARELFKNQILAILTAIVFLLQPFRINVATGGMETSLFITGLLLVYDRYLFGKRSYGAAFWGAVVILIRPDAILALIPLFIHWVYQDWKEAVRGAIITVVITLPWIVWATLYFGSPLPHTITAKSITYKILTGEAVYYLLTFLGTGTIGPYASPLYLLPGFLVVLPVFVIGLYQVTKELPKIAVIVFYPALYLIVMSVVNPAMYFSWYYPPLIPGLLFGIFSFIWFALRIPPKQKIVLASAAGILLLAVPGFLLRTNPGWPLSREREIAFWDASHTIKDQALSDKVLFAPDIGVIGWALEEVKILDPIGLVSPEALPYSEKLPSDQLVAVEMILEKEPDFIISLDQFINPAVTDNQSFQSSYTSIYEQNVKIVNTTQSLHIFQLNEEN
jgi:hypothetical protein